MELNFLVLVCALVRQNIIIGVGYMVVYIERTSQIIVALVPPMIMRKVIGY